MKRLSALALLMFVGCCEPEIRYVRVEVPVAVPCPAPPELPPLDLPIHHLPPRPTNPLFLDAWRAEVVKAAAASSEQLLGEVAVRDKILDGYRQKGGSK